MRTLTIADFSPATMEFRFSIGSKETAASLRRLADAIDAGTVVPQQVELIDSAEVTDFQMTTLRLKMAEKQPPVAKELYGDGGMYPLEVARP